MLFYFLFIFGMIVDQVIKTSLYLFFFGLKVIIFFGENNEISEYFEDGGSQAKR